MKVIVKTNEIEIEKNNLINSGEYNITPCEFEFSEEYNGLTKMAVFSTCSADTKVAILNNRCVIPYEVLENQGQVLLGVYGYESVNDELELRYSPTPKYFYVIQGSYKEGSDPELPPKSEWEQVIEEVNTAIDEANNLNIEAEKVGEVTTITITHKDGEEQEVQILDGEKGDKGDKGDPGSVKFIVVQTLPTENIDESAIYLTPSENPDLKNHYDEWIWVTDRFEPLGETQIEVDLTDYVKNTDYASVSKGGVIKTPSTLGISVGSTGNVFALSSTYADYGNRPPGYFIGKETLDNVITGKGLVSNTDYATDSVGGVIKSNYGNGFGVSNSGALFTHEKTYAQYTSGGNAMVIGKGTLENVITGKGLVSNTDYASSNTGGVIKATIGNQLQVNSSGELTSRVVAYSSYGNILENAFISKGTLENVLTAKIGDIQTLLDNLDIGNGVS